MPRKSGGGKERRCIVTGEIQPAERLVRFVADPEARVVPDIAGRLPGRGMWVTASADAVNEAVRRNAFSRSAKAKRSASGDLAGLTERRLAEACLGRLGLARKAGDVVTGFEKTRAALERGELAVLLVAADSAPDGRGKMLGLAKAMTRDVTDVAGTPLVAGCFTSEELTLALGGAHVVHAGVVRGRFDGSLASDLTRLHGFRPLTPPAWMPERSATTPPDTDGPAPAP